MLENYIALLFSDYLVIKVNKFAWIASKLIPAFLFFQIEQGTRSHQSFQRYAPKSCLLGRIVVFSKLTWFSWMQDQRKLSSRLHTPVSSLCRRLGDFLRRATLRTHHIWIFFKIINMKFVGSELYANQWELLKYQSYYKLILKTQWKIRHTCEIAYAPLYSYISVI